VEIGPPQGQARHGSTRLAPQTAYQLASLRRRVHRRDRLSLKDFDRRVDELESAEHHRLFARTDEVRMSAREPWPWRGLAKAQGETISERAVLQASKHLAPSRLRRYSMHIIGVDDHVGWTFAFEFVHRADFDQLEVVEGWQYFMHPSERDDIVGTNVISQPHLNGIPGVTHHQHVNRAGVEQGVRE